MEAAEQSVDAATVAPAPASATVDSPMAWPGDIDSYEFLEEIGRGASAVVWKARVRATGAACAVKQLNLESAGSSLDELRKEIQVMGTVSSEHLLSYYVTFNHNNYLYLVMPLLAGSALDVMRTVFRTGLDESLIAPIIKQVVVALAYLHERGHIHRDIKAGNLLISETGNCCLSDFGVSTALRDGGQRLGGRQTFVGTPCWMAPEVIDQMVEYNDRADIWSLGITAIELATGSAPLSQYPPLKVLMMTLSNPPPTLNDTSTTSFSRAFKDFVEVCLQRDFNKRPTAEKLLEHKFLKNVKVDKSRRLIVEKLIRPFQMAGGIAYANKQRRAMKYASASGVIPSEVIEAEAEFAEAAASVAGDAVDQWDFDDDDDEEIGVTDVALKSIAAVPVPVQPAPISVHGGSSRSVSPAVSVPVESPPIRVGDEPLATASAAVNPPSTGKRVGRFTVEVSKRTISGAASSVTTPANHAGKAPGAAPVQMTPSTEGEMLRERIGHLENAISKIASSHSEPITQTPVEVESAVTEAPTPDNRPIDPTKPFRVFYKLIPKKASRRPLPGYVMCGPDPICLAELRTLIRGDTQGDQVCRDRAAAWVRAFGDVPDFDVSFISGPGLVEGCECDEEFDDVDVQPNDARSRYVLKMVDVEVDSESED